MNSVEQNEIEEFRDNGFLVRKDFIDRKYIDTVVHTFVDLCGRLAGNKFIKYSVADFGSEAFDKDLILLRENSPSVFGALYDTMQSTVSMQKLALNRDVVENISKLLDVKSSNLMCFNYLFRMDAPFCNRNKLDWHQDFIDYDQKDMAEGITAWFPLVDIEKTLGPLKVLRGSHLDGKVTDYEINTESKNNLSSHYHSIDIEIIKKYKQINISVHKGDIIYISMNLIHSSGDNTSRCIRFSGQGRYFNILSPHFPPGRLQFTKSKL